MSALDAIVVFVAARCPHCRALVEDFRRRGVVFRVVDVGRDPAGLERVRTLSWERRLPLVLDHERVSIGYRGASSTLAELGLE